MCVCVCVCVREQIDGYIHTYIHTVKTFRIYSCCIIRNVQHSFLHVL